MTINENVLGRITAAVVLSAACIISIIFVFAVFAKPLRAETLASEAETPTRTIVIRGKSEVIVTTPQVKLFDVAEVKGKSLRDDETILALEKIDIVRSPQPGEAITVSAQEIISRLRVAGVDLSAVGYVFPRIVHINRASRSLAEPELRDAIASFFLKGGREATVRQVNFPNEVKVAPGEVSLDISPLANSRPGSQAFAVTAKSGDEVMARFNASAMLEEWGQVPVATRGLQRGSVIGDEDITLARVNLASVPRDATDAKTELVGLKVSQDIGAGDIFRRNAVFVPPVIEAGSNVTVIYRSGALEATAAGTALDAGIVGATIRVRNDNSKKVLQGTVREAGIVEVKP